jgi:AcrR family transcriptional regulator
VGALFLVSGTKRSGTSMWMQILAAAGLPFVGEAFPRDWGSNALKAANSDGFFESILRDGIYHATNPHPTNGKYFEPADVAGWAVKVFVPGVVRTERGYIELVVANIRPWREYEASVQRLWQLEDAQREPGYPAPPRFPGALEWWVENFSLVRDIHRRRYRAILQTYPQVLADPERYIARVLRACGRGDLSAAIAVVKPDSRTQRAVESDSIEPELAAVFDALYARIEAGAANDTPAIDAAFLAELEDTHRKVMPRLRKLQAEMAEKMWNLGLRPPPPYILGVPRG